RLRPAAAADRGARLVPRVADDEFSGSLPSCLQLGPRHARRQGLRFRIRQADDRDGADRLDDWATFRGRLREAWPQQDEGEADNRAFLAAAQRECTAELVLT